MAGKSSLIFIFWIVIAMACSVTEKTKKSIVLNQLHGNAQGTTFTIKFIANDSLDYSAEIASVLQEVDQQLSTYVENSVISVFNNTPDTIRCYPLKDTMFTQVFEASRRIFDLTEGAFNPAVMPLVKYWGFAFKSETPEKVDSVKIDSIVRFSTDFTHCRLLKKAEENCISVSNKTIQLDLNGIAQGYSVDVIAGFFLAKKIDNFMIEIGGEVRTMGKNDRDTLWTIGIDKPASNPHSRELQAAVSLNNRALATSGNYRKFYEKDGVKYAHTIDPVTGFPVQHTLLSASVIAPDCTTADALATAFMVMGTEKTKLFLEQHAELGLEVFLIYSDADGNFKTWMSEGMKKMTVEYR